MRKEVCLIQRRCEDDAILLAYQGEAQIENDEHKMQIHIQCSQPSYELKLYIYTDAMILEHRAQHHTRLSFRNGHQTSAHVENEMGRIDLSMHTDQYIKTEDSVFVRYAILNGELVSDTFELKIEMGGGMK